MEVGCVFVVKTGSADAERLIEILYPIQRSVVLYLKNIVIAPEKIH